MDPHRLSNLTERLDPIRKRPAMYIGSVGSRGLYHLLAEALDNSMEEAIAGHARNVDVVLHSDNSLSITDNGRGIPVDILLDEAMPGVTVAFTQCHGGRKLRQAEPRIASGDRFSGMVFLNALSECLEVTVRQGGSAYFQRFERGVPVNDLLRVGQVLPEETGTCVRWSPDPEIFADVQLSLSALRSRLRLLAFLSPGTRLTLRDEAHGRHDVFRSDAGAADYVEVLNTGVFSLHDPVLIRHHEDQVHLDVAIQYREDDHSGNLLSFANHRHTRDGGFHERGFWTAMTEVLSGYARSRGYLGEATPNLCVRQISRGLTAVLSVRLPDLVLEGSTRTKLGNEEVEPLVTAAVRSGLEAFIAREPLAWQWKASGWCVALEE